MRRPHYIAILLSLTLCAAPSIAGSYSTATQLTSQTLELRAKIQPLGVDNKSIYEDPKLVSLLVKSWGEVKQISSDGSWFTISDGYAKPIKVVVNGVSIPSDFSEGKTVDIIGVVSLEINEAGEIYPIILLGETPIVH